MYKTELFGIPVSVMESTVECVSLILDSMQHKSFPLFGTNVNPRSLYLALHDSTYRQDLNRMDILYPDGIGFVIGLSVSHGIKTTRISFDCTSLYHPVFETLDQYARRVFLIGGKPGIADAAAGRIKARFPNVDICGAIDGYQYYETSVAAVMAARPDFVLCGMGAPNQERFLVALRSADYQGIALTCGGFLDQLVQRERYYPPLINKLDIRFAYRLYKEPRRLAHRYLVEYRPFLFMVARSLLMRNPRRHSPKAPRWG